MVYHGTRGGRDRVCTSTRAAASRAHRLVCRAVAFLRSRVSRDSRVVFPGAEFCVRAMCVRGAGLCVRGGIGFRDLLFVTLISSIDAGWRPSTFSTWPPPWTSRACAAAVRKCGIGRPSLHARRMLVACMVASLLHRPGRASHRRTVASCTTVPRESPLLTAAVPGLAATRLETVAPMAAPR